MQNHEVVGVAAVEFYFELSFNKLIKFIHIDIHE